MKQAFFILMWLMHINHLTLAQDTVYALVTFFRTRQSEPSYILCDNCSEV